MSRSKVNGLFELRVITENPLFEGFALSDAPSLLGRNELVDDLTPAYGIIDYKIKWSPVKLKRKWRVPAVEGRVAPFNDYPGINMMYPAFSSRACVALKEFLEPNGELLPLKSKIGDYYFYNITTISDALDVQKSDCEYAPMGIEHFEFVQSKLMGLSIFRLYEWPMGIIVTKEFIDRVYECGLNGFQFSKLWPYSKGTNWHIASKKGNKPQVIITRKLKQNTLVLFLQLKQSKPNSVEKKKLKKLEAELDAQLMINSLESAFFGSYEGCDLLNHEYRLFLSCPDADRLRTKLGPWLNQIDWLDEVYVMSRYGNMYDEDAEEELEKIK